MHGQKTSIINVQANKYLEQYNIIAQIKQARPRDYYSLIIYQNILRTKSE